MIVLEVKAFKTNKYKITTDNEIAFVLYKGDLSKYKIYEGSEISEETVKVIFEEVLPTRAFNRCLYLLNARDYTEYELRNKLLSDGYPAEIAQNVIIRIDSYGYLDDYRYACGYIESRIHKKSREELKRELIRKGVKEEIISEAFGILKEENRIEDEVSNIKKILQKRHYNADTADYQTTQKQIQYLYRKGFKTEDIRKAIKGFEDEDYYLT